jgi:CubicO group peptidase (beta-lactamase class C family)
MTSVRGLILVGLVCSACGGGVVVQDAGLPDSEDAGVVDAGPLPCSAAELAEFEQAMRETLTLAAVDAGVTSNPNFTVLLETFDGRTFSFTHGTSSATTVYESASTSKWVTGVVLMDLVDRGALTLETKAHDLLPFWVENTVTLRHLLSFRSGFNQEPFCVNLPNTNVATCVEAIYDANKDNALPAGTQFEYSSAHMAVAGLMAIRATNASGWTQLFSEFKGRSGLFPTGVYDLPSANNPRLAGGMHWTATEYQGFLRALAQGTVLSDASRAALFANQRGAALVTTSPALGGLIAEDWSYGLGNWLECPGANAPNTYNCGEGHRNSSPGAYGSYPFIDFDSKYFGIVAQQGALGSGDEGVQVFRTIRSLADRWATKTCAR